MNIKYDKLYRDLNVTPTKQRVELANIIFSKKQHFTANELISMADRKKLNISMATIYNTLSLLEDKGMLKTINIDELKFYDTNLDHHHHLYNMIMSTLTDIDSMELCFAEIQKNLQIEKHGSLNQS